MARNQVKTVTCQVCGKKKKLSDVRPAAVIREPIVEEIRKKHPDWSPEGYICNSDLNKFRESYVSEMLFKSRGEVSDLEEQVIQSLKEHELVSSNVNAEFERELTFGQRLAKRQPTPTLMDDGISPSILTECRRRSVWGSGSGLESTRICVYGCLG